MQRLNIYTHIHYTLHSHIVVVINVIASHACMLHEWMIIKKFIGLYSFPLIYIFFYYFIIVVVRVTKKHKIKTKQQRAS
jgi:hypothetical protein